MRPRFELPAAASPEEALQQIRVWCQKPVRAPLPEVETVAGLDLRIGRNHAIVGLTVVHYWTQQVDTSFGVFCPAGYYAGSPFRRAALAAHALAKLTRRPGALIVRGREPEDIQARLLGLLFELPTVACGPSRGWPEPPGHERGSRRVCPGAVAATLRTRPGGPPILVVPVHRSDVDSAVDLVLGLSRGRYPAPLETAQALTALLEGEDLEDLRAKQPW